MSDPDTINRPDELVFLALGGVGEIGMNMSLYGYRGRWLMIDCGITFADDTVPGIDIIMPDPEFIAARAQMDSRRLRSGLSGTGSPRRRYRAAGPFGGREAWT